MFCGTDVARRIEAAEAALIVAATEAARARGAWGVTMPIGGGFACAADADSPMNKVVGLGFAGAVDPATLDEVEKTLGKLGVHIQVELSNLADPDVAALLTSRGYRLVGFENVLGQALPASAAGATSGGISVRRGGPADIDTWIDAVVEGFAHPDDVGVASHEEFPRDVIAKAERDFEKAGAVAYLAYCGDAVAGGGGMRITHGVAQLTVRRRYRRPGGEVSRPRFWRHASTTRQQRVATSPSSPQHRVRRHRRTCSAEASS